MRFSSLKTGDTEARFRRIENHLRRQGNSPTNAGVTGSAGATATGIQGIINAGGSGGSGDGTVTLAGDVLGANSATKVVQIEAVPIPAPAVGDDQKFVRYKNATPTFEYANVPLAGDVTGDNTAAVVAKANGIPLPTPAAADNLKALTYIHGSLAYQLKTPRYPIVAKSADYLATDDDMVILVDASGGARTITLPTAVGLKGKVLVVKKTDAVANAVTVDAAGAETIDGALTQATSTQYVSFTMVSDNANWYLV